MTNDPAVRQFPRHMSAVLWEPTPGTARMTINSRLTGDPLTDNHQTDDGYRFHDVFHLVHAALLGWSPVLKSLMGLQNPRTTPQKLPGHGKPPTAIEEGITAMVFAYASRNGFYLHATKVEKILLGIIQTMTQNLQAASITPDQWQHAILTGYALWREIYRNKGGHLLLDLDLHTITLVPTKYHPPHEDTKMPGLITGDNLLAFDIVDQPHPDDDGTGPDHHLVVYTLEDSDPAFWTPRTSVNADQLAAALNTHGLLPQQPHHNAPAT